MKDLISKIITDDELTPEAKTTLIEKIVVASHGIPTFVGEGLYLHTSIEKGTGEISVQLWARNSDGVTTDHAPTGATVEQIFEEMKKNCLSQTR